MLLTYLLGGNHQWSTVLEVYKSIKPDLALEDDFAQVYTKAVLQNKFEGTNIHLSLIHI